MASPAWDIQQNPSTPIDRSSEIQNLSHDFARARQHNPALSCWLTGFRDWAFIETELIDFLEEDGDASAINAATELKNGNWSVAASAINAMLAAKGEHAEPLVWG